MEVLALKSAEFGTKIGGAQLAIGKFGLDSRLLLAFAREFLVFRFDERFDQRLWWTRLSGHTVRLGGSVVHPILPGWGGVPGCCGEASFQNRTAKTLGTTDKHRRTQIKQNSETRVNRRLMRMNADKAKTIGTVTRDEIRAVACRMCRHARRD